MTLLELSVEYRAQATVLRTRICELQERKRAERAGPARSELDYRIKVLEELYREARDIAVLTERYYERGYRRNARYTL